LNSCIHRYKFRSINGLLLFVLFACGPDLNADPFMADTQATEPTDQAAKINPANAAFIPRSRMTFFPRIHEIDTFKIRYPNFKPVIKKKAGLTKIHLVSFVPSGSDSEKSRIGWAITEILPPITVDIDVKEIPILVLGQQLEIDINAEAKVNFGLGGLLSYRVSKNFAVGIAAAHRSLGINVGIGESGKYVELASVKIDLSQSDLRAGMRYESPSRRFAFGLASLFFQNTTTKTAISSTLVESDGGSSATTKSSPMFLKEVLTGVAFSFRKVTIYSDLLYTRADPSEKVFSVIDLAEKSKDNYDTVAVRSGVDLKLNTAGKLAAGFAYVPADTGPGSVGSDGKAGFGLMDVIMVSAGFQDLKPYTVFVAGIRKGFGWTKSVRRRGKGKKPKVSYYPKWIGGLGIGYQKASLGVDAEGEQPGAYSQTKIFIPAQISRQF
jgi:hypothetical protein